MNRNDEIESVRHLVNSKLRELLPSPVRPLSESVPTLLDPTFSDPSFLVGGEPGEVIAGIDGNSLRIYLFGMRWVHPHIPVVSPKLFRTIALVSLPADPQEVVEIVRKEIAAASKARKSQFRTCRFCQESVPPEHQHDQSTCHVCAENHLGIVH